MEQVARTGQDDSGVLNFGVSSIVTDCGVGVVNRNTKIRTRVEIKAMCVFDACVYVCDM